MIASLRALLVVVACGAVLAPPPAPAHSTEFILAKVTPRPGGVTVELTADYGGNPMFANEAEAGAVLGKVLRVHTGGTMSDLTALAPMRFEKRTQLDPTAPIPRDSSTGPEPHQLLCALWAWDCAAEKVVFEMPADAGQSMILWTPVESSGKKTRWAFLLPGDVSPEIPIPERTLRVGLIASVCCLPSLVLGGVWVFARGSRLISIR